MVPSCRPRGRQVAGREPSGVQGLAGIGILVGTGRGGTVKVANWGGGGEGEKVAEKEALVVELTVALHCGTKVSLFML